MTVVCSKRGTGKLSVRAWPPKGTQPSDVRGYRADMPDEGSGLINGRYRLISVIGQGAMGIVWRGHDEMLGREVAIKKIILPEDPVECAELKALAMQEARATAALHHPSVITVYDVVEDDGAPVIVMELIEGESLAEIIRVNVRLPWRRVAELGAAMADALGEAHAAGIVHRDLKPANVLIAGRRVVITDFGIAQRAGEHVAGIPGEVSGTPAFMSPEQAENAAASPAADLWSLGATLFNAVEGVPPYQGPDYASVLLLLLTQDPPRPRNAGPLTPLITALFSRVPARRPTVEQVAEELAAIQRDAAPPKAPAPPPPAAAPLSSTPPRRSPVTSATSAARVKGAGRSRAARSTPAPPAPGAGPALPKPRLSSPGRRVALTGVAFAGAVVVAFGFGSFLTGHSGAHPATPSVRAGAPGSGVTLNGSLAFSPSGTMLAAGETEVVGPVSTGLVELFDAADHQRAGTITLDTSSAATLAFSPDGGTLAVGTRDGDLELWNVATRTRTDVTTMNSTGEGADDDIRALQFSRDGKVLYACDDVGQYGKWTYGESKPVIASVIGTGVCHALSPDGTALTAYTAASGELTLWKHLDGHPTQTVLAAPWRNSTVTVSNTTFSPDGRTLAVTRCDPGAALKEPAPGAVEIWDVASQTRLATHDITLYKGSGLAIGRDGKTLAATAADGDIDLWKIGGYQRPATITAPFEGGSDGLVFSGAYLAAAGNDGTIRLYDPKTDHLIVSWPAGRAY